MFYRTLALSAALALMGGAAFAQGMAQATLQEPLAKPTEQVAAGAVWSCQGSSCAAQVDRDTSVYGDVFTVFGCEELVRLVGPVSTYTRDGQTFTASQLDSCNRISPKASNLTRTAAAH